MVLDQFTGDGAANPLLPNGFEMFMSMVLVFLAFLPIVLVVVLLVLLVRWIRSSRLTAAASGEMGVEIARRVDSIEHRLGNIEKTLAEAGEQQ